MLNQVKKLLFEQALALGTNVGVRFIPGAPGVEIPTCADTAEPTLFLYGLNMARPIPDLRVEEDGIHATLAFGREEHLTFVPWTAVAAIGGDSFGAVFALSPTVPVQVEPTIEPVNEATPVRPGPRLRLVRGDG
jgi:hypothetical protein